jgi:DNA repair protein RadC
LDNKHRLLKTVCVSVGSLSASIVHPRDVFVPVIKLSAAAVIFTHNHPSGDPTPSKEDIVITRRLREVGELVGVRVLDHIIVGKGRYVSFVDDGYW